MRNTQLYLFCKKIHRLLVILMIVLGSIMAGTGYMMHEGVYILVSAIQIRFFHNNLSILFSIILGIMSLTGLYLFLFPYLKVKREPPLSN